MSEPNRRECRFDRIGRSQVGPVLGREVIEAQQLLAILPQAFARFLILGVVFFQEVIECCLGGGIVKSCVLEELRKSGVSC